MKYKLQAIKIFLFLFSISQLLTADNAQWTGTTDSDLNTASNWLENVVPTGIATFDSEYPSVEGSPTASALFTIDNIYFTNSASAFYFTFTDNASLEFTGDGITGSNVDTTLVFTNGNPITNAQLFFNPTIGTTSSSLGSADITMANDFTASISFQNAAQLSLADSDAALVVPVSTGDDLLVQILNGGLISGTNEAGQVFLKGSSFTTGDDIIFLVQNTYTSGASITASSHAGQVVFNAGSQTANLTLGDNNVFLVANGTLNGYGEGTGSISSTNNNAGQIIFDGNHGSSIFTAEDNLQLSIVNQNGSTITNTSSGNNVGQMIFDGNHGIASFISGENAQIGISILGGSTIQGEGFDTGQLVIDGNSGEASFILGNSSFVALTCDSSQLPSISSGTDGNDAGQIIVDGNNGTASFSTGDNCQVYVSNVHESTIISLSGSAGHDAGQIVIDGNKNNPLTTGEALFSLGDNSSLYVANTVNSIITSSYNTGQLVVDGNLGTASLTIGDNSTTTFDNNGVIANTQAGSIAAQLVFNGSTASTGSVSLNAGTNSTITATLGADGTIFNTGALLPAQIYFHDTIVTGSPTITTINLSTTPVEGIIFDGSSTATHANIALQNSSLSIDTTGHPLFKIGSLTGNSSSLVKLNQDLQLQTTSGTTTTFSGVIFDNSGTNNLTISGSGTQVLGGNNLYGGDTTVNKATLLINGSVLHNVTVNNGGTLGGTGTVHGDVVISASSTASPGLTPGAGTLHIDQSYTQASTATLNIQVTDSLSPSNTPISSLLDVTGTASLAGTLNIVSANGTYSIGRTYTVLSAGAISGTFDQISLPSPFLNATIIYDPDPAVQMILSTAFASGAQTSNQLHVAEQIDGIAVPIGDEEVVINNLLALTTDELPAALNQMTGDQYCYLVGINQYADYRFGRRIFDNIRNALDPCSCNQCCGTSTWIACEFEYGRLNNRQIAHGYKEQSTDVSIGANITCDSMLYGAAVNIESNRVKFDSSGTNTIKNVQGALYAAYAAPRFYLFSDFIVGQGSTHFKRDITFADIVRTAQSSPRFTHGLLYAEAGLNWEWCEMLIQPFVGGDCNYVNMHGFHEHGAQSLNLWMNSRSVWAENVYAGAHFTSYWDCIQFNVDLIYQHRFGNLGTTIHPQFIDFGDSFAINGADYPRDGFIGNINAAANLGCFDLYVEFTTEQWSHQSNYSGSAGISCCW